MSQVHFHNQGSPSGKLFVADTPHNCIFPEYLEDKEAAQQGAQRLEEEILA